MQYKITRYSSLLNKITSDDKLFRGNYTLDPYQNCEFGCLYCDSYSDNTIYVKSNADIILEKQLQNIKKGVIIIGSVDDPYQKAEEKYRITRKLLTVIKKNDFPCHILTKSDLIVRDIDIISKINNCIVTMSILSLNNSNAKIFEKNVPSPMIRLKTVKKLSKNGIKTGIAVIPLLPFIVEEELEDIVRSAYEHKAHYILYKYLELKGDQRHVFLEKLKIFHPELMNRYEKLYKDSYIPDEDYITKMNSTLSSLCKKYCIKNKI